MGEKIKYCAKCNTPIPSSAKFCFECGGKEFLDKPKAKERYCKNCFIKLDSDEEVCPLCEGDDFASSIDELYEIRNREAISKDKSSQNKIIQKIEDVKTLIKVNEGKINEQKQIMYKYPSIEEMNKHLIKEKEEADNEIAKAQAKYNKYLEDQKKAKAAAIKSKDYESEYEKLVNEAKDIDAELATMNKELSLLEHQVDEAKKLIDQYEKRIKELIGKKPEFYDVYLKQVYTEGGRYLYEWGNYYEAEYFLLKAHNLDNHVASSFLLFMYLDVDNPLYNENEASKIADTSIEFFKKNKDNPFYEAMFRLCCSIKESKHYSPWAVNEAKNNFAFTFTSWIYVYANYLLLKRENCYPEMYLILCDAFNKTIVYDGKQEAKIKQKISNMMQQIKAKISKVEEKIGMELYQFREVLVPDYYTLIDARQGYSRTLNAYKSLIESGYYKALGKFAYLSRIVYSVDRIDDRKKELLLSIDTHKSSTAIAELGWYYLEKFTVRTQSNNKALEYFKKSYEMECLDGAVGLGICYLNGYGVEKNEEKGLEYLKLAAEHTCHRAYTELGKYYFRCNKYEEALPYLNLAYTYKEAVHYELAWTKNKLGAPINEIIRAVASAENLDYAKVYAYNVDLLYLQGLLHERKFKYREAVRFFQKAAEKGHVNSIKWMIKDCEKQKDIVKLEYYKKLLKEVGA